MGASVVAMMSRLTDLAMRQLMHTVFPGDRVIAAVSGGSDSLGMLVLLDECRKQIPFHLTVATVNHGLRDGVEKEIELVRRLAFRLDIPFTCLAVSADEARTAAMGGSIQAWARDRRYALLSEAAIDEGARFIAVGHTEDDQAETVLLRMLRGAGIDGISGIPKTRRLTDTVSIVRPVLGIQRRELRTLLRERDIHFADDPSNDNPRFLRVRVRQELLPRMHDMAPDISRRLAALASDAAAVTEFFESDSFADASLFARLRFGAGIFLDRRHFDGFPQSLWTMLVRRAIREVKGDLRRIERVHLEAAIAPIAHRHSTGRLPMPDGIFVSIHRGSLLLFPQSPPSPSTEVVTSVRSENDTYSFDFDALGVTCEIASQNTEHTSNLTLRSRRKGDKIGSSDTRLKDVFIETKVPRIYRDFVPLLCRNDRVIATPDRCYETPLQMNIRWRFLETAPFLDLALFRER